MVRARFLVLLVVLSSACASASRESRLARCLNKYADDIRWRRWGDATALMVPSLRRPFLDAGRRRGPDFRVADLEYGGLFLSEDIEEATVTMQVTWYTMRETFMRTTVIEQQWKLLDGEWLLVRERHADGEPM